MSDTLKAITGLIAVASLVALGVVSCKAKYDACRSEGFGRDYCIYWVTK